MHNAKNSPWVGSRTVRAVLGGFPCPILVKAITLLWALQAPQGPHASNHCEQEGDSALLLRNGLKNNSRCYSPALPWICTQNRP